MPERVLVIGGTGTTGSQVAIQLAEHGVPARIASRRAGGDSVYFDWADPASHAPALAGTDGVYLVAPIGVADPLPLVEPFLRLAVGHGCRVALLSSSAVPPGTPGLGQLHEAVRDLVPEWTVLQPSWFMQNFVSSHPAADSIRTDGEVVTATGSGRVAFVDARDIAAVAVRALVDETAHNTAHVITGPEALSYQDITALISAHTGTQVRHRSVSVAELAARLTTAGYPADFAAMLAALDDGIRRGSEDRVTDTVPRITGRPARSFAEFLAAQLPG